MLGEVAMGYAENDDIRIEFDGKKCIHARRCVLGLPDVFNPGAKGQWMFPDHAKADDIAKVVESCPSGALKYRAKKADLSETVQPINTAKLWENGPVEYRGRLEIAGQEKMTRAVICRCGKSKNKPFCDNSHLDGFEATGEVPAKADADRAPDDRGGEVNLNPVKNGPLMVSGHLEVVSGSGRRIACGEKFAMCRCGASKNKPFCDGSHKAVGFEAD
ncbi:CDGSH iron-sulfur domain-containing protein [Maritalea mediterranea]|uniref:CDGSH iron-sulfur domain-containing protein n=1 Tax=Maritalea mediterranea TaxID=2909667 RepID=A0ABS9EA88_9HYPH|nr:CDGSH iron-sulfur domain-containing protein [Maritalea mediterranea]MCF4099112.1 CDGSH iron-sulfur domain-containing protein [Maritalea mediterranea]